MKSNDLHPLFPKVFGDAAETRAMTYPIPDTKQSSGRASLAEGFPVETMTPLAAGGVPPDGTDINGILKMLSTACQRGEAGFVGPWRLDLANAIGGYPRGAIASYGGPDKLFVSLIDDNTADPNQNATAWRPLLEDVVRSNAVTSGDANVGNLVGNVGTDPLGSFLHADLKEGGAIKVVGEDWVLNYGKSNFLSVAGGGLWGKVTLNTSTTYESYFVHSSTKTPTSGQFGAHWGDIYLPFNGSSSDERGKVYLGYFDTTNVGPSGYLIQVNDFGTPTKSMNWKFTTNGTLQSPQGNDFLEIRDNQGGARAVLAFNVSARDGDWVRFQEPFKAATVVLNLTPQDTTVVHTMGFRNLSADGFKISISKWDGSRLVPEDVPMALSVMAIGPV